MKGVVPLQDLEKLLHPPSLVDVRKRPPVLLHPVKRPPDLGGLLLKTPQDREILHPPPVDLVKGPPYLEGTPMDLGPLEIVRPPPMEPLK